MLKVNQGGRRKIASCTALGSRTSVHDIVGGMRISIASPRQMGKLIVINHQNICLSSFPSAFFHLEVQVIGPIGWNQGC
jgi:hypothetical protein